MIATVLIVAHDAEAREMLRLALVAEGAAVATADSSRAALDRLRSSDVACILLDLDGVDAARFRAAQRRDRALAWIPLIVISSQPDAPQIAEQLGARAFLRKPFALDQLEREVTAALERVPVRSPR